MKIRGLDLNHDWLFGRGKNDYLLADSAIALNIKTRILSWVGDCFFDMTAGIDWINRLGKTKQRELLELDLRRIILTSEGVTGIISFNSQLIDRSFSAQYEVRTENSTTFLDNIKAGGFNG
ncbi:MAG: hypothetical protein R3D71_06015 [Rickettsiales bacterium]